MPSQTSASDPLFEPMQVDSHFAEDVSRNPFKAVFPGVITAMQVTEESEGMCLWAGTHQTLYRYFLGQRTMY